MNFRLHNMIDGQSQRDARQWPKPTRVSGSQGIGIQLSAASVWNSEDGYQVILAALLDEFFYFLLTIQVKRTAGCSGRAVNLQYKQRLCSGAAYAGFNGRPRYTFNLSDYNQLLAFEFQRLPLRHRNSEDLSVYRASRSSNPSGAAPVHRRPESSASSS